MKTTNHKSILIAEDSKEDFDLINLALEENKYRGEIEWFKDGDELILFLQTSKKILDGEAQNDYLILLDINMPKRNGFDTLTYIKSDDTLKLIPCIMLTTSEAQEDLKKGCELGANLVITKPFGFDSMVKLFESINSYWLKNISLPNVN